MTDLFWPGDERAGGLLSESALLSAMVRVEAAWLDALVEAGIAPAAARDDLAGLAGPDDVGAVALGAESGGNPVIPLVALLRERAGQRSPEAARWLHRGLTSQDVLDTALVLTLRDAIDRLRADLARQVASLATLADTHRRTAMVARTLTQHAVPTTFGLKAAQWLAGVLDAGDDLAALAFPVQVGGAAGTLAAAVELAAGSGLPEPRQVASGLVSHTAAYLALADTASWHTSRAAVTRIGDTAVRCTDAWGRIANDVLTLARPEIGELSEAAGRGGSSTMPQKANPVLSVLVRRAALAAPPLAATLHLAAAGAVDERPDGAWHAEWATLRTLVRRTVVAGAQATELLAGIDVHPDRMAATLAAAAPDALAEQRSIADLIADPPEGFGRVSDPAAYLGAAEPLLDAVLDRARRHLKHSEETA